MNRERKAKHTSGKWEIIEHSWSDTSIVCGDYTVATKSIYDEATEENQEQLKNEVLANFKIMAASPEMYEMLKELVAILNRFDQVFDYEEAKSLGKSEELIKKIEG